MSLEERKLKVDIKKSYIDIAHKKILVLIGGIAGSWIYGLKFVTDINPVVQFIGFLFLIAFAIFMIGIVVNYFELNRVKQELKELENE